MGTPVPDPVEDENSETPEPSESQLKRMQNAEEWFQRRVEETIASKKKAAEEAAESARLTQEEKERVEKLAAEEKAARKAWEDNELQIRTTAEQAYKKARHTRDKALGAVCWPLRAKTFYVSYSHKADFRERCFVAAVVNYLTLEGLGGRVWIDKDEGVLQSPYRSVDRWEALSKASCAIVIVSKAYLEDPETQGEMAQMRGRVVAKFGNPLTVHPVAYESVSLKGTHLEPTLELDDLARAPSPSPLRRNSQRKKLESSSFASEASSVSEGDKMFVPQGPLKDLRDRALYGVRSIMPALLASGGLRGDTPETAGGMGHIDIEHPVVRAWVHAQAGTWRTKRLPEWTTADCAAWLDTHGKSLAAYSKLFYANQISGFLLLSMTAADMAELLGIEHEAHRTKFMGLLQERLAEDDAKPWGPSITELTSHQLHEFVLDLFLSHDVDHNGYLDRKEFQALLKSMYLGLNKADIASIMSEADDNNDGVIEYREFLPFMVNVVQMVKARQVAQEQKRADVEEAKEVARLELIHGMTPQQLEAQMRALFAAADKDGSGELDRHEFCQCLKDHGLGLSRREINHIITEVDTDNSKTISYNEFIPACFNILTHRFQQDFLNSKSLGSAEGIAAQLLEAFERFDETGSGQLQLPLMKRALMSLSNGSLGLSRMQIMALLAETSPDKKGWVQYSSFVPLAATMLWGMLELRHQGARAAAINQLSEDGALASLRGVPAQRVKEVLFRAFTDADLDSNGTLDRFEFDNVIRSLQHGPLAMSQHDVNVLMVAVDESSDGKIQYGELLDVMFEALFHMEREKRVQTSLVSASMI